MNKNIEKLKKLVNYDFEQDLIEKHIGNEKRTFSKVDKQTPLLSPSRISKVFTEHIFWNIPEKNLYTPRFLGQLIHFFIEKTLIDKEEQVITRERIIAILGNQSITFEDWSLEEQNNFTEKIIIAVDKIKNFLIENEYEILAVEKHIANNTYHGFPDLIAIKDDSVFIIDLKTSGLEYKESASYYTQLGIYKKILESFGVLINGSIILHYNVKTLEIHEEKLNGYKMDDSIKLIDHLVKFYRNGEFPIQKLNSGDFYPVKQYIGKDSFYYLEEWEEIHNKLVVKERKTLKFAEEEFERRNE